MPLLRSSLLVVAALVALIGGYVVSQHVLRSQELEAATVLADFSLPDVQGKSHWLSEWQGRTIVLNFWATWCPPCKKEIPWFVEFKQRSATQGLEPNPKSQILAKRDSPKCELVVTIDRWTLSLSDHERSRGLAGLRHPPAGQPSSGSDGAGQHRQL